MRGMFIAVIGLAALILIFVLALLYCFVNVFYVDRKRTLIVGRFPNGEQYGKYKDMILKLIRDSEKLQYEDVYITSFDGVRLHGKYYETAKGAPLQIMFHGYRSNAVRDLSGGMRLARELGHNILLVDERAHGQSEGRCLSFGILERYDCLAWTEYAAERFGDNISVVLVGISMGASTVLMASELRLPSSVKGIIADCGYDSPRRIILKVLSDKGYPVRLTYPLIRFSGMLFGGFDIENCTASDALAKCNIPVLFIHGEDDRFVPCEMSASNFEACAAKKTLVTFQTAGHGMSYLTDEEKYKNSVYDFIVDAFKS